MRYRVEVVALFWALTIPPIAVLLYVFGNQYINYFSVVVLSATMIVPFYAYSKDVDVREKIKSFEDNRLFFFNGNSFNSKNGKILIIAILLSNVVFAILNSYLVMGKIKNQNDIGVENVIGKYNFNNYNSIWWIFHSRNTNIYARSHLRHEKTIK